jgi:hypothetical protein
MRKEKIKRGEYERKKGEMCREAVKLNDKINAKGRGLRE